MTAYISLGFIFLEIRKREYFWILTFEFLLNHKPAKGSLSSSQLFATSPHYEYVKNHYRVIAVDLSEQKELDVDPKEVQ